MSIIPCRNVSLNTLLLCISNILAYVFLIPVSVKSEKMMISDWILKRLCHISELSNKPSRKLTTTHTILTSFMWCLFGSASWQAAQHLPWCWPGSNKGMVGWEGELDTYCWRALPYDVPLLSTCQFNQHSFVQCPCVANYWDRLSREQKGRGKTTQIVHFFSCTAIGAMLTSGLNWVMSRCPQSPLRPRPPVSLSTSRSRSYPAIC